MEKKKLRVLSLLDPDYEWNYGGETEEAKDIERERERAISLIRKKLSPYIRRTAKVYPGVCLLLFPRVCSSFIGDRFFVLSIRVLSFSLE